ncbi:MAG: tRNA pseudouridine(13) synthase TruD [Candidatus Hermodarchaeota archaeon]
MENSNHRMKSEKSIEKQVGIEVYSTSEIEGIGGIYKNNYKDFIVKEILKDGTTLSIKEDYSSNSFLEQQNDRYTTFNLIKINKDSFDAFREISKALKIPRDLIYYSGLKDKCSISVQKVSIAGNYLDKIKKLKIRDSFFRSIRSSKKPVKIGDNWGNNFTITIRNIDNKKSLNESINSIIKYLLKHGFPNYYGLQRFGIYRPNSHLVGRYLLEGRYKEAFEEFVTKIYPTENETLQKIRNNLKMDGDFRKAYEILPRSLYYERIMVKHLINNPNDYEGCFKVLHKDIINLLISAFQSFIFNKMLSLRIKKGIPLTNPIKGDTISILEENNDHITQIKYVLGAKKGLYDKYLTKAIDLNRARIILPIVGYETNLSEFPLMKNILTESLEQEGIDINIFNSKLLNQYDFKGAFRAMMMKPTGLRVIELTKDNLYPGKMKLKIEFSLLKGSYATMILRELIK